MASKVLGLDDVLEIAIAHREEHLARDLAPPREPGPRFGAAGVKGLRVDREMASISSTTRGGPSSPSSAISSNPMDRMFGTSVGRSAANAIGNEGRTLEALQRLSLEIMAQALRKSGQVESDERLLVRPGKDGRPPVLMVMSPRVESARDSRMVSEELDLPLRLLLDGLAEAADEVRDSPEATAFQQLLDGGPEALAQLFLITQPEVVLTRQPRMVPLCVPSPHVVVNAGGMLSTAGVLCLDDSGEFGVTACYHGTGPAGTPVTVGSESSAVKHANPVQDTVFIPLTDRTPCKAMVGVAGVRQEREPARADPARFNGAVNQNRTTRIMSADAGLLRARPTIMLKVQTDADTDQGDSGCALLDENDRVLGFAFERTAYDDYPQFTDWIWAANALRALKLTPYTGG